MIVIAIAFVVAGILFAILPHTRRLQQDITNYVRKEQLQENMSLYWQFDALCGPVHPMTAFVNNGVDRVNCGRSGKGEFKVLSMADLLPLLREENKQPGIRAVLERVLPHVHVGNRPLSIDDIVVIDVIAARGAYFPSIHTDIEWEMYSNAGFQVWMLLENWKEKGNMFMFESDETYDGGGASVKVRNNQLMIKKPSPSPEWKPLSIRKTLYLAFQCGDLVVFNQNMLHMSDFRSNADSRLSINFRVLIRKPCGGINFSPFKSKDNMLLKMYHAILFVMLCGLRGVCPLFGPSV